MVARRCRLIVADEESKKRLPFYLSAAPFVDSHLGEPCFVNVSDITWLVGAPKPFHWAGLVITKSVVTFEFVGTGDFTDGPELEVPSRNNNEVPHIEVIAKGVDGRGAV